MKPTSTSLGKFRIFIYVVCALSTAGLFSSCTTDVPIGYSQKLKDPILVGIWNNDKDQVIEIKNDGGIATITEYHFNTKTNKLEKNQSQPLFFKTILNDVGGEMDFVSVRLKDGNYRSAKYHIFSSLKFYLNPLMISSVPGYWKLESDDIYTFQTTTKFQKFVVDNLENPALYGEEDLYRKITTVKPIEARLRAFYRNKAANTSNSTIKPTPAGVSNKPTSEPVSSKSLPRVARGNVSTRKDASEYTSIFENYLLTPMEGWGYQKYYIVGSMNNLEIVEEDSNGQPTIIKGKFKVNQNGREIDRDITIYMVNNRTFGMTCSDYPETMLTPKTLTDYSDPSARDRELDWMIKMQSQYFYRKIVKKYSHYPDSQFDKSRLSIVNRKRQIEESYQQPYTEYNVYGKDFTRYRELYRTVTVNVPVIYNSSKVDVFEIRIERFAASKSGFDFKDATYVFPAGKDIDKSEYESRNLYAESDYWTTSRTGTYVFKGKP